MCLKVGVLQYDIVWEDKDKNKEKILKLLKENKNDFDLLILPEMSLTGFSFDINKTSLDESDIDFFKDISKKYNTYIIFGGVVEKKNKAITLKEDEIISEYSKIHLFSTSGENKAYIAGIKEPIFNINDFNVNVRICYDLRFSYLFWEKAKDVDLNIVIANWPKTRSIHWDTLLRARAIENQNFIIGVNRLGSDPNVKYSGDSKAYDPFGDLIVDCKNKEGLFTFSISKKDLQSYRNKFLFLNDRVKN
jgi:omega-amidase